jgi:hypothetical protein
LQNAKTGGDSEVKMNKFILYFSRLALSLQGINKKEEQKRDDNRRAV